MNADAAILGQVALGYSPFIDRHRAVSATRLTVVPLRPDAVLDVGQLLHEVGNVWPATGARVSLNIVSESLLQELLVARPSANLMVEVPAFMAADAANTAALVALHAEGSTLLLKGRPLKELPREVLPCFAYSIIDLADDRRLNDAMAPSGITRRIGHVQSGVRTVADMEACFARGAEAVLGWPIDDAVTTTAARSGQAVAAPGLQAIVELIRQVDREDPIEKLENTMKRDPALASMSATVRTPSSCCATSTRRPSGCGSRSARSATRS
jgi:c-di-GMP phosphodiesterase